MGVQAYVAADKTVRTYLFPDLTPQHVLNAHRAAVNAVSISNNHIISVSGDRSLRLWDAETGALLRTFENHHRRGYVREAVATRLPTELTWVFSWSPTESLRLITNIPSCCRDPRISISGFLI